MSKKDKTLGKWRLSPTRYLKSKKIYLSGGQAHVPSVTDCTSCSSNATSRPNLHSGRLEPSNLTTWARLLLEQDISVESNILAITGPHNLLKLLDRMTV